MEAMLWSVLAGVVVLAVVARATQAGLGGHVRAFMKSGDVDGLIGHIETLTPDAQPTAYNTALLRVWGAYQRRRATELVREMGSRVGEAAITQYWIRKTLEVEPEIAREILDEDWLERHYVPEVARQCGSFG